MSWETLGWIILILAIPLIMVFFGDSGGMGHEKDLLLEVTPIGHGYYNATFMSGTYRTTEKIGKVLSPGSTYNIYEVKGNLTDIYLYSGTHEPRMVGKVMTSD